MRVVRKYRLYPNQEQEAVMLHTLEYCRRIWNFLLSKRQQSKMSKYDCDHEVYLLKQNYPYLRDVYSHVLQNVSERLDLAFQHFFRRLREGKTGRELGYPRVKRYGRYDSFTYPDAYNGSVKLGSALKKTKLHLSKLGYVRVVVHRSYPEGRKEKVDRTIFGVKTCTIKREGEKWFAILVYETKDALPEPIDNPKRPVGIDLGVQSVVTTSDGKKIEPLNPLKKSLKRLRHLQRLVSRKKRDSNNRQKAREKVSTLHWKIGMQRRDALHKLTYDLSVQYDLIVFEDLNLKGMLQNHLLARSLSDVSLAEVVRLTQNKAERLGHRVLTVSPNNTSTDCSRCGFRRMMPLSVRTFHCERCGLVIDRDVNSARTILERGLEKVGQVIVRTQACGDWSSVSSDIQPISEAGSTSPRL